MSGIQSTRRRLLLLVAAGASAGVLAGCGGEPPVAPPTEAPPPVATAPGLTSPVASPVAGSIDLRDFSAQFAAFPVADEPNGDLARVVWPAWIDDFDPEVKQLYSFQITNGPLMRYMPCFCGCQFEDSHQNVRDCFVDTVNPDGSVVFDTMAPTCMVCLDVTRVAMQLSERNVPPRLIRTFIDNRYAAIIERATPTPYPPA